MAVAKVLLTVFFRNSNLMLAFLRDRNSARSVTEVFEWLYETLGHEQYCRLFPIILTDRGSEFTDPVSIECTKFGEIRSRVFYCDPQRSDQKGGCEVTHEFIRRVLPKGTSFDRKRQTSPRIKGRHPKSPRWRSFIYEAYSILPGHLREAGFQPMLHQFHSVAAHFAEPTADNGTDLSRSPSPFQSDCRSRCWPERRPAYWRQFFLPITNGLMLRSARLLLSSSRPSSRYLVKYGHCSSR